MASSKITKDIFVRQIRKNVTVPANDTSLVDITDDIASVIQGSPAYVSFDVQVAYEGSYYYLRILSKVNGSKKYVVLQNVSEISVSNELYITVFMR